MIHSLSMTDNREVPMRSSEIIVTLLIWVLTAAGMFFGLRKYTRKKKSGSPEQKSSECDRRTRRKQG